MWTSTTGILACVTRVCLTRNIDRGRKFPNAKSRPSRPSNAGSWPQAAAAASGTTSANTIQNPTRIRIDMRTSPATSTCGICVLILGGQQTVGNAITNRNPLRPGVLAPHPCRIRSSSGVWRPTGHQGSTVFTRSWAPNGRVLTNTSPAANPAAAPATAAAPRTRSNTCALAGGNCVS